MKIHFTHYLHDDEGIINAAVENRDRFYDNMVSAGIPLGTEDEVDEFSQKVGRPFYEVELHCTLDTVTGEVEVLKTDL